MASTKYINDPAWAQVVTNLMKGEKGKAGMQFSDISEALEAKYGLIQSRENLINKVNRGNFSAQLLIAMLRSMGVESLDLRDVDKMLEKAQENMG